MNGKTYYKIINRLLAIGGIILIWSSRKMTEPQNSILGYSGLAMIAAMVINTILFHWKPGSFKDKSPNPDEER